METIPQNHSRCQRPSVWCPNATNAFVGLRTRKAVPAPCQKDRCAVCGPRRRWSFVERTKRAPHLRRELTIDAPLDGVTKPNIRRLRKCWTDFKRWLDRANGYKGRPAWGLDVGERGGKLHVHGMLGDYGYQDFRVWDDWMIAHGYYSVIEGKIVAWRTHYRWLQSQSHLAGYLAKYIAKQAEVEWPPYTRVRYTPIPRDKHVPDEKFEFVRGLGPARALIEGVPPLKGGRGDVLNIDLDLMDARVGGPRVLDRARARFERRLSDDLEQIDIRARDTEQNAVQMLWFWGFLLPSVLSLSNKKIHSPDVETQETVL